MLVVRLTTIQMLRSTVSTPSLMSDGLVIKLVPFNHKTNLMVSSMLRVILRYPVWNLWNVLWIVCIRHDGGSTSWGGTMRHVTEPQSCPCAVNNDGATFRTVNYHEFNCIFVATPQMDLIAVDSRCEAVFWHVDPHILPPSHRFWRLSFSQSLFCWLYPWNSPFWMGLRLFLVRIWSRARSMTCNTLFVSFKQRVPWSLFRDFWWKSPWWNSANLSKPSLKNK